MKTILLAGSLIMFYACGFAQPGEKWLHFDGGEGPGKGKHIVLVSGDEEYRSEQALPMLARILSTRHGFTTTVLFAIDPETGLINPDYQNNIPGLEALENADLMILFTRFRELPDGQMKFIDTYLKAGKPVIAMRTATHAFFYQDNKDSQYAQYSWNNKSGEWEGGFGRRVLGETWVDHHGEHGVEGTRGLLNGIFKRKDHPVLRGVTDIWGYTDVYGTRDLAGDAQVLVWGQSTTELNSSAPVNWEKSVMPIIWTRLYQLENGMEGRSLTTTIGASVDLESHDLRRLLINGAYWLLDMEVPEDNSAELVGEYHPTMFGFGEYQKGLSVKDLK